MLTSTDIPELLQPGDTIPLPGRILSKPYGSLIWDKKKTSIVSPYLVDKYVKIPVYLIENNNALGIIILNKPTKLSLKEIGSVKKTHMLGQKEIIEKWPNAKFLYNYPIELISKFDPPKAIIRTEDIQTWLPVVTFKRMEFSDPSDLTDNELFDTHKKLHEMWFALDGIKKDIINYHIILRNEIVRREFEHEKIDELDIESQKVRKKNNNDFVKIYFRGSKGITKEDAPSHELHTAIICENKGKALLISSDNKKVKALEETKIDFTINTSDEFNAYKVVKFGPFDITPIPVINSSNKKKYAFLIKVGDKRIIYAINVFNWHSANLKKYVKNIELAIIDGFSLYKNLNSKGSHASIKHQLEKWYTPDRVNRVMVANLGSKSLRIGDDELITKMRDMTEVSIAIATDNKIINLSEIQK